MPSLLHSQLSGRLGLLHAPPARCLEQKYVLCLTLVASNLSVSYEGCWEKLSKLVIGMMGTDFLRASSCNMHGVSRLT